MFTAIIFIIVIGVLVLVHEFGHFVLAKRAGMKVEEFGFGFPPRALGIQIFSDNEVDKIRTFEKITIEREVIESKNGETIVENITDEIKESKGIRRNRWHFTWGQQKPLSKDRTIYSINWIPFGGFVKILGEDGDTREAHSFASASFLNRILVLVAGVVMNFLLAAVLLMVVNFFGLRIGLIDDQIGPAKDIKVQIVSVTAGSPAEMAGLQPLDAIEGYKQNGAIVPIRTAKDVQDAVNSHLGQSLTLEISHGDGVIEKTLIPRANPPEGQGAMGISLALTGTIAYPWYEAIWRGISDAAFLTMATVQGYYSLLKTLFIHGKLIADVSGPIGIASLTGQAARVGFNYLLQFVAMISINLAVLNIIPFPALDGGRVLMLIIEKIKGSPVRKSVESWVNMIGFYLLVALMVYITYKDVAKFFIK